MNKAVILAGGVAGAVALLVAGDYLALYGTVTSEQLALVEMQFSTHDEVTGEPVAGVHVRCFQSNNNNACAASGGGPAGNVITISVPLIRLVTRSYLFTQSSDLRQTADPYLKVMFIHPDYANPIETFPVSELQNYTGSPLPVAMPHSMARKY